jgi:hypothetical protein
MSRRLHAWGRVTGNREFSRREVRAERDVVGNEGGGGKHGFSHGSAATRVEATA